MKEEAIKRALKYTEIEQSLMILQYHQKWRKGGEMEILEPREYGGAIDVAIKVLEKELKQLKNNQ